MKHYTMSKISAVFTSESVKSTSCCDLFFFNDDGGNSHKKCRDSPTGSLVIDSGSPGSSASNSINGPFTIHQPN